MEQELGGAANGPARKRAPSPVGSVSFVAPLLDAEAAKPAQNCPPHRSDRLRWPGAVQNWAVPRIGAVLRLVDAGCSHDVDVHQDAQLHGPGDARKRPRSCPWRPGPLRAPRRAPELRYSKAKRPATAGSNSRCIAMDIALCAAPGKDAAQDGRYSRGWAVSGAASCTP